MSRLDRPIYLDCAATTPIDPRVRDVVLHYMDVEFGNAGSHTHIYGQEAAKGVKKAREQIADVVDARPEEVIFTSGATEANNLATLGLYEYALKTRKRHIVSTHIEHKAVIEPLQRLENMGFEVDLIHPNQQGYVDAEEILAHVRKDTCLVTVMHVNNETGVVQPIPEIAEGLKTHECYFHVDAAQGFGKHFGALEHQRIDLLSASAHKLYAPSGVGCLIARRHRKANRSLFPIYFGGGQERGLRPGTLPTALICGFGKASEIANIEIADWRAKWKTYFAQMHKLLTELGGRVIGEPGKGLGNIINFSIPNLDSEVVILALKEIVSISNGSACTSSSNEESHVVKAMYQDKTIAQASCRASWCHLTPSLPIGRMYAVLNMLNTR